MVSRMRIDEVSDILDDVYELGNYSYCLGLIDGLWRAKVINEYVRAKATFYLEDLNREAEANYIKACE